LWTGILAKQTLNVKGIFNFLAFFWQFLKILKLYMPNVHPKAELAPKNLI